MERCPLCLIGDMKRVRGTQCVLIDTTPSPVLWSLSNQPGQSVFIQSLAL